MPKEKSIHTFTLCDEDGTKYEVSEFIITAEISGDGVLKTESSKIHTVAKDYKTSDGQYITFEDGKYRLEETGVELYPCEP